jgi:hypothetical protein
MRTLIALLAASLLQLSGPLAAQTMVPARPGADRPGDAAQAPTPETKGKPAQSTTTKPKKTKAPTSPRKGKKS